MQSARDFVDSMLQGKQVLMLCGNPIIPLKLLGAVQESGGIDVVRTGRTWQTVRKIMGLPPKVDSGIHLNRAWKYYFEIAPIYPEVAAIGPWGYVSQGHPAYSAQYSSIL